MLNKLYITLFAKIHSTQYDFISLHLFLHFSTSVFNHLVLFFHSFLLLLFFLLNRCQSRCTMQWPNFMVLYAKQIVSYFCLCVLTLKPSFPYFSSSVLSYLFILFYVLLHIQCVASAHHSPLFHLYLINQSYQQT